MSGPTSPYVVHVLRVERGPARSPLSGAASFVTGMEGALRR